MSRLRRLLFYFILISPLNGLAAELTVGEEQFVKAVGRDCPVIRLWPDGVVPDEPRAIGDEEVTTTYRNREGLLNIGNVSNPSMIVLTPSGNNNTGAAIILCPGGGYGSLGCDTVIETAKWMNERGITVVLLKYRVPKRHHEFAMNHQPVQDAQRAMGILRTRSAEWKIAPNKIGIGGFSAGGHVAASLAINHAKRWYKPVDALDETSCRPDFAVLLYPAYLTDPITSRERDAKLNYDLISATATPPTLISITRPDKFTVGSIEYYLALMEAKVAAELHIYPDGGHGGAIEKYPFGEWANECYRFLGDQGILEVAEKPVPLTYKAKRLPDIELSETLTLGDQRLGQVLGRDCPVVPVWPNGFGPDETLEPSEETVTSKSRGGTALNITQVTKPTLTIVRPTNDKATGKTIIVCPGGAYGGLAAEHEGTRVCEWLNELGITGILLKYRVPRRGGDYEKHHHALQDLQRAIRIVRANAAEWDIDSTKIGVCGFSAGGHLCTVLSTNFQTNWYEPIDVIDKQSCRPDFAVLTYPAYLTEPLDSNEVDPNVLALQRSVTPPMFLSGAENDRFTRGMLNFYLEIQAAKLSAECHVYATGGHGGGIDPISYPASEWTKACERWLRDIDPELERRKAQDKPDSGR